MYTFFVYTRATQTHKYMNANKEQLQIKFEIEKRAKNKAYKFILDNNLLGRFAEFCDKTTDADVQSYCDNKSESISKQLDNGTENVTPTPLDGFTDKEIIEELKKRGFEVWKSWSW